MTMLNNRARSDSCLYFGDEYISVYQMAVRSVRLWNGSHGFAMLSTNNGDSGNLYDVVLAFTSKE